MSTRNVIRMNMGQFPDDVWALPHDLAKSLNQTTPMFRGPLPDDSEPDVYDLMMGAPKIEDYQDA